VGGGVVSLLARIIHFLDVLIICSHKKGRSQKFYFEKTPAKVILKIHS